MLKKSRLTIRYIFLAVAVLMASETAFAAVPATPTLYSPSYNSTVNGTLVSFSWNSVANVTYYWLQLSTDSQFTTLLMNKNEGTWTSDIYSPLPDNGTWYYWRVKACNGEGCGNYSTAWSFLNGPSAAPGTPSLTSPANGTTVNGTTATFQWTQASRASSYLFELAYDSNFQNISLSYDSGGSLSVTATDMPDNGLTYYWHACAYNSKGESCSSYRTIKSGPSAAPSTPTLYYPDNGVDINDLEFALVWDPAARAADYYLQVATDSQFTGSNIVYGNWLGGDANYYFLGGLLDNDKPYYWRVKAKNSLGESAYSTSRWFTYYDNLTCTSVYGSGIGVTNNTQSHIDTCYASDQNYYLYDISRRTGQQAGHDHTGGMKATEAIKTKDYAGYIYDDDNVWSNDPYYDYRPSVDAHAYAEKVYDYLYNDTKGWQLNSYDGTGSSMVSTVEKPCDDTDTTTAKWDEVKVIYYTSCDGAAKSWAGALDLVAHYWGDAVTDKAGSGLLSQSESGALWVAFSDWLGAAVENYYDPGDWNWTIGEDILNIQSDLSNPQSLSHPDTYKGLYYYDTENCTPTESNDNCWVHTNSGVPNKMFHLLSQGGTLNGVTVQGIGITKAMEIALKANMGRIWQSDTTLKGAVVGMKYIAEFNYGTNSNETTQVKNAWAAVGLGLPVITTSSSPSAVGTTTGGGEYEWGQSVKVMATGSLGYNFDKWTEDGFTVSNDANYDFTASESRNLVANFISVPIYSVTASAGPNGTINPSTSQTINYNGTISFTITPNTGYHIASVTGCGGTLSGNTYTTGMITADCTVTASFAINTYTLTVTKSGTGSGTVTSSPSGISCGSTCSGTFNYGTSLTLTAATDSTSNFAGWSGACSGTGSCTVTMNSDTNVTASFDLPTLTVSKTGVGTGTVTSSPSGISCGSDCTQDYNKSTSVTLTATADPAWDFTGWSGSCSGTQATCPLTMSTDTSATAGFGCLSSPVRIPGKGPYPSLQAAYNAAAPGDIIQARAVTLTGNINANRNIAVTIRGGFDCHYSSNSGTTMLQGQLTTSAGVITIGNFSLEY